MKDARKMFRALPAAFLLLAGCYSLDVASGRALDVSADGTHAAADGHVEHVVVSNYGWYLFNRFPIACGNTIPGSRLCWSFFSDQVSPALLHDRMMSYAADRNAAVKDLVFSCDEQVFFQIPGLSFEIPIPYVLCFREVQFSGILAPRAAAGRETL